MSSTNIKNLGQKFFSKNFENDSYTKNLMNKNLKTNIQKNNENFNNLAKLKIINDENVHINQTQKPQPPPADRPTLQLVKNRSEKRFNEFLGITKKE